MDIVNAYLSVQRNFFKPKIKVSEWVFLLLYQLVLEGYA